MLVYVSCALVTDEAGPVAHYELYLVVLRCLQRFLRNGDDYRNARLMMIPSVVEGPLPVRMLAPPKREISVHGERLQLEWKSLEGDGKKQCPHLEVILDCLSRYVGPWVVSKAFFLF